VNEGLVELARMKHAGVEFLCTDWSSPGSCPRKLGS
jgi:hypothetical protein